jgi:RNA polymerase sigma factor (sigma-70 family)
MSVDVLSRIAPLVRIIAAEHTHTRPDLFDDAVQEGMIAAWQSLAKGADDPRTYAVAAARYGVIAVLRGRPATGNTGRQGWQDAHDSAAQYENTTDVDSPDPTAHAAMASAEWSTERTAVAAAIRSLPPRDQAYVVGRFYLDMTGPEIAEHLGIPNATLNRRFRTFTIPTLSTALAHLADAA